MYRGRQATNAPQRKERQIARKEAKRKAIGEMSGGEQNQESKTEKGADAEGVSKATKPLSAEELSKK